MGGAMKYFLKELLGHEIFRTMSPRLRIFFEKFVKSSGLPSTYLMYTP